MLKTTKLFLCLTALAFVACDNDDEGTTPVDCTKVTYYADADSDGLGNPDASETVCPEDKKEGYVTDNTDVDDTMHKDSLDIPSTYSFENVSYAGQIQRLGMLNEIKSYIRTGNTPNTILDSTKLSAMFSNAEGAGFAGTYDDSKQLKSKTFEAVREDFEYLMGAIANASQSTVAGTDGIAGVVVSTTDDSKQYLLGTTGVEYAQLIEKGLMGACFYYQGTTVYMGDDRMNVDNETVEEGEGTAMEHHWDEAFGYLGVPIDFPTNTDGLFFWGNYSNVVNGVVGTNQNIMNQMLKGRAAISAKNLTARDEARAEARKQWELVSAATAIHYLNGGLNNIDDPSLKSHNLSEAIAFVYALQFNEKKSITNEQVNELLTIFAGSSDFRNMNLYNTTGENINEAKDKLADYFNLEDSKDDL